MNTRFFYFLLLTGFVIMFNNSCKKDDDNEEDKQEKLNKEIIQWMYDAMSEVYFWSNTLPEFTTVSNETDPEKFFNSLIYTPEDKWSWLTDDYESLMQEFAGTPKSIGISPVFGQFSGTDKVFILVAYVYPGSPADLAGIKRGDIIVKIDNMDLTTTNYYELYSQEDFTVTLGNYFNGSISVTSTVKELSSQIIDSNPVIFDTILQINDHKIAYLVYVEFISGENGVLLDDFGQIIDEFKAEGATDLVIDLRYNPGGEISAANYLASTLAPVEVVDDEEIFVKFLYNPLVQLYFENTQGENSSNLVNRFDGNGHNIGLNRIFFLTGQNTASASELLMIGLEPYMDVIHIGEPTYGKYTGAWVLTDTNDPPKHNWAIVPIVSKYSNAEGLTDFKNGLEPDYFVEDNLVEAVQFGDPEDPMLSEAIGFITGSGSARKSLTKPGPGLNILHHPSDFRKYNLFLPSRDLNIR